MLNTIRKRLQGDEGFTLVELLVVILIIGILAAIAIPSFLNQKGKGEDAAAKASAREIATALETNYTDTQAYSADLSVTGPLHTIEPTLPLQAASTSTGSAETSKAGQAFITTNGTTTYAIEVWSKPSGRVYKLSKDSTGVSRTCLPTGQGGCPSTGSW